MFSRRVEALLHFLNVVLHCRADIAALRQEVLGELRRMAAGDAEGVVHHQDLAVGAVAGADADDRNGQRFGDLARQLGRHAFQHQQLNTGQFQILRVLQQLFGGQFVTSLYLIAAEHVDRLRRQAQVAAHRHCALGEHFHRVAQPAAAFQFHHVGAGAHQLGGVGEGLFRGGVTHERQIGQQQAGAGARRECGRPRRRR